MTQPHADKLWQALLARQSDAADGPRTGFGSRALWRGGRMIAFRRPGTVVVRGEGLVERWIKEGLAKPYQKGGRMPIKGWAVFPVEAAETWLKALDSVDAADADSAPAEGTFAACAPPDRRACSDHLRDRTEET